MFKIKEQLNPRDAFELSHPEEIYLNVLNWVAHIITKDFIFFNHSTHILIWDLKQQKILILKMLFFTATNPP